MRNTELASTKMRGGGTASSPGNPAVAEFEELAMPIVNSTYNFARWLARNDHDAEDLVQETFLKAFRSFSSFQAGTNFRAWILKILRNTFLSSRSRRERWMMVEMESEEQFPLPYAANPTPESLLIDSSSVAAIRDAIEELPTLHREVILLCDVENASYREIAEILSVPIGTVMSRLSRARKTVRDALLRRQIGPVVRPGTGRSVRDRDHAGLRDNRILSCCTRQTPRARSQS